MTNPITTRVKSSVDKLSDGVAFASNSFKLINTNKNSIEKELSRLNANGTIKRFRKGIYYKPKQSSLFGEILPSPTSIAHAIAYNKKAGLVLSAMEYIGRIAFNDNDLIKDFATKLSQDDIKDFLALPLDEQQAALSHIATQKGLPLVVVEKDLWVTIVLHILFSMNGSKGIFLKVGHLYLKGLI